MREGYGCGVRVHSMCVSQPVLDVPTSALRKAPDCPFLASVPLGYCFPPPLHMKWRCGSVLSECFLLRCSRLQSGAAQVADESGFALLKMEHRVLYVLARVSTCSTPAPAAPQWTRSSSYHSEQQIWFGDKECLRTGGGLFLGPIFLYTLRRHDLKKNQQNSVSSWWQRRQRQHSKNEILTLRDSKRVGVSKASR